MGASLGSSSLFCCCAEEETVVEEPPAVVGPVEAVRRVSSRVITDGKTKPVATSGKVCLACCCFCTWCCAFMTVGPVGICCLGIFLTGNAAKPFDLSSTPVIIAHQGMPDVHPAHTAEGYEALPAGVVWEADLQPPNDQGVVYVSHDPVAADIDNGTLMTLDTLLELADNHSATLMPEFKGSLSAWGDQNITDVSDQLCNFSTWMQTFHADMADAIRAGCGDAYIMCLRHSALGASPEACDGEGRHWSGITWVSIVRGISGETRPLYIYGTQSRLHLRAVSAVLKPQGAWSDNAAGMLGTGDPTTTFDLFFSISFFWFGIFGWCTFGCTRGCMVVPFCTVFERDITKVMLLGAFLFIQLIFLVLGILLFGGDAWVTGAVTSLVFWLAAVLHSGCFTPRSSF